MSGLAPLYFGGNIHIQYFDVIDPFRGRRVDTLGFITATAAARWLLPPAANLTRSAARTSSIVGCPVLRTKPSAAMSRDVFSSAYRCTWVPLQATKLRKGTYLFFRRPGHSGWSRRLGVFTLVDLQSGQVGIDMH